jgi:DNA-binding HxlR family transcriptional regulator
MGSYRQYCPIARSSEILAERWNPLIVRNLMFGADTFSELARGVPAMSRSMLIKRLKELELHGILTKTPKPDGPGHLYHLTEAGADLADVVNSLATWGERWLEVTAEHADPGFALWVWCQVQLNCSALPQKRTLIAFNFPQEAPGNRYYWMLVEKGDAELCYSDPGGDADVSVTAQSLAFVDWHRGRLSWPEALRSGLISFSGDRRIARSLPTWNVHTPLPKES